MFPIFLLSERKQAAKDLKKAIKKGQRSYRVFMRMNYPHFQEADIQAVFEQVGVKG